MLQWFGIEKCADLSSWCRAPCGSRIRRAEPCCSGDCCLTWVGLSRQGTSVKQSEVNEKTNTVTQNMDHMGPYFFPFEAFPWNAVFSNRENKDQAEIRLFPHTVWHIVAFPLWLGVGFTLNPWRLIDKKKRTAAALKGAREKCVRLHREAASLNDHSAPQEHLRAAARHLAAVEKWLLPPKSGASTSTFFKALDAEELLGELGLSHLAEGEDLEDFLEYFSASIGVGELLVLAIPCLMQSKTFRHPGTFYITSDRLCFRSSVLGMEARLSISWSQLEWARLVKSESSMHPVRICLRQPIAIDAVEVDSFDLMIFDVGILAQLHACVSYFNGTGLFDMVPLSKTEPVEYSSSPGIGESLESGPRARMSAMTPEEMIADLEEASLVWELQRRTTIWHSDWRAPFLPHDYQKAIKWMAIEEHYIPHPFIPEDMDIDEAAESVEPPIREVKFLGRHRPCEWHVVIDESSDADGWQYAVDFYLEAQKWSAEVRGFSHVRRRRWQPTFLPDRSTDETPPSRMTRRLNSTLMAEKGVSPPEIILTADLGIVPLEAIKTDLEMDDWLSDGHLMKMQFKDLKAYNIELGPWLLGKDAGTGSKVQGKLRSMEMRVPVPPAPMCPKESRVTCTWHVVSDDSRVLLESVLMSLDAPYGTCFNVIKCDTFSLNADTGRTRFERRLSLEWVKSCWVKALVEANVPREIKLDGEKFVEVVKDWAQTHAVHDNSVRSAATRCSGSVKSSPQARSVDNSAKSSRKWGHPCLRIRQTESLQYDRHPIVTLRLCNRERDYECCIPMQLLLRL